MKTIQLRTYTIVDGELDAFLEWWRAWIPRVRAEAGFAIDFAYVIRESHQFVWAVSAEGNEADFLALEATYTASEARAEAFAGVPQRVAVSDVRLVEAVV